MRGGCRDRPRNGRNQGSETRRERQTEVRGGRQKDGETDRWTQRHGKESGRDSHRVINRETDTENQKHRERTIRKTRIEG